jgi:nitrate/nitrite-specific signal transduction histidine kinase
MSSVADIDTLLAVLAALAAARTWRGRAQAFAFVTVTFAVLALVAWWTYNLLNPQVG